nr:hypothetical protein [uncultured Flavonifractor sp.]
MLQLQRFFLTRPRLTLIALWCSFGVAMLYGLTALLLRPDWNFWLVLLPGAAAFYFRLLHARIQEKREEPPVAPVTSVES